MKTFVKAMNGEVKIESKHESEVPNGEQGTRVTLIFPAVS